MCYNEINGQTCAPCSVKIISAGGETNSRGSFEKTADGVKVYYLSDGDQCTFFFKEGKAEYGRTGSQYVHMVFEEGKTTLCEIGCGNMKGSFEIKTVKLKTVTLDGGQEVLLEYESGQDGERTKLSFTVLKN